MPFHLRRFLSVLAASLALSARAQTAAPPAPHGAADFEGATQDARRLQLAPGFKLDIWAADPQLANGVAFTLRAQIDPARPQATPVLQSYIAESYRWANSIFDITQRTNWLLADMAFRNVQDRARFLQTEFATNLLQLTKDSEQVRLVEDRDGDHRADHSEVFANGFNSIVDGTAAGILAYGTNLWFANIPNLTRLSLEPASAPGETPDNSTPKPTPTPRGNASRTDLATGFGVHIGVSGHDLHGLIRGPDGRIYMSIGDRGLSITNREGLILNLPDCGSVLRCEPDGRNLEVFCYGLRNPQELAFDDLGNLWTVDNDTAGADPCRVLHLVEDGDYGWRTSYQHMEGFGPWVQEELWKGGQDGILPPAGTVSQGPSGLAYTPGPLAGDRFANAFLHCDFPGGVVLFTVKSSGASFTVDRKERFAWNCWPTDVDFGPDGAVYILDWVTGWGRPQKGRIYRITPTNAPGVEIQRAIDKTFQRLATSPETLSVDALMAGLADSDRRVRLQSQWELAARGVPVLGRLATAARTSTSRLERLHALWGIRQLARAEATPGAAWDDALLQLIAVAFDPDALVAAEAVVTLGEMGWPDLEDLVGRLLSLSDPAVRRIVSGAVLPLPDAPKARALTQPLAGIATSLNTAWAKETLARLDDIKGKYRTTAAGERVRRVLGDTPDDRFLQHAAARLLFAGIGARTFDGLSVAQALTDDNVTVRQIAVIATRRIAHHLLNGRHRVGSMPALGYTGPTPVLLTNVLSDPEILIPVARAIHDVPVVEALPVLASFITKIDCPPSLHSRVIDACFRLGTQQHAQMLAGFAARRDLPEASRVLALQALAEWERPSPLDRVNGLWRPLVVRHLDPKAATNAAPKSAPANPLLSRAAEAQAGRNLGRAAELPLFPTDLGRSVSYDEATHLRRNPAPAQRAFLRVAGELMDPSAPNEAGVSIPGGESKSVQLAVVQCAVALRTKEASSPLYEKFLNTNTFPEVRRAIVGALARLKSPAASEVVKAAILDADPLLKASAMPYLDRLEGDEGNRLLQTLALETGADIRSRQAAWREIGLRTKDAANALTPVVAEGFNQLEQSKLPEELHLEVLSAAESTQDKALQTRRDAWLAARLAADTNAAMASVLRGGTASQGRRIFYDKPETQCSRCHAIAGNGGTVGPSLDGVGKRLNRNQILESIANPNAQIAAGFENLALTLKNGTQLSGMLRTQTASELTLLAGEDGEVTVRLDDIAARDRGPSAMPEGLVPLLSRYELRDLIEFLASLK